VLSLTPGICKVCHNGSHSSPTGTRAREAG
jgi:hypothetical protein